MANNTKEEFREICLSHLKYIRNIDLPDFSETSKYETALIEYRCLPHMEFLIRNTIIKLGNEWCHTIVCGNLNYNYIVDMCSTISDKIKIIKTNYDNLFPSDYSLFLSSLDFWNLLNGEKILIYQEDSMIFNSNINDFLQFDYIGAPWPAYQTDTKGSVGNGGISLRSKEIMIKIINSIGIFDTVYNSSTLQYIKSTKSTVPPEDVYFSKNMEDFNIGVLADRVSASNFSTESILNTNSFAGHNFWINDPNWKNRVNSSIIQVKPNYKHSFLEHRGGWKSVLESLIDNSFFNKNSNIEFFDLIERMFLWDTNYKCLNKWCGIIHCTPVTPPYLDIVNISKLFNNVNFIESLENCLFIVTLSSYITNYLNQAFKEIGKEIVIYTLKHPVVSENIPLFDYNSYIENENKSIIQIGQQLRQVTSIYLLNVIGFNKLWLTGMKDFTRCEKLIKDELEYLNIDPNMLDKNVKMYYTKTFDEYDDLVSKNIVFVHLFDAAANNTIIECIIRNTPIIVNKHIAVVEYLGEDYPLYYNDLNEVSSLLTDEKILEAHNYLCNKDKSDLSLAHFTKQLMNITNENVIINKLCIAEHMECAKRAVQVQSAHKYADAKHKDMFSYNIMCDLLTEFAGSWKDYGIKYGLDTNSKCVEHAIRASFVMDATKPAVFDWRRYIKDHPDLQRALGKGNEVHVNDATMHYLHHGIREKRRAYVLGTNDRYVYDFDWETYDRLNPDVYTQRRRNVGRWHCFRHWCEYGYKEGRRTGGTQTLVVNNVASISTDEEVNKRWRDVLGGIVQLHSCKSIESIVNLTRNSYYPLIVMPTYNRAANIEYSIQMMLNQGVKKWTFLIIDDGSTVENKTVFRSIRDKYMGNTQIVFLENDTNKHIAFTLNRGIQFFLQDSKFTHFTWVSDDNEYYPTFLEKLHQTGKEFVYSWFDVLDKVGGGKHTHTGSLGTFKSLLNRYPGCAAFMWSKDAITKVGLYNENVPGCEDYEYMIRTFKCLDSNIIHHVNCSLMKYILHSDSEYIKCKPEIKAIQQNMLEIYRHLSKSNSNDAFVYYSKTKYDVLFQRPHQIMRFYDKSQSKCFIGLVNDVFYEEKYNLLIVPYRLRDCVYTALSSKNITTYYTDSRLYNEVIERRGRKLYDLIDAPIEEFTVWKPNLEKCVKNSGCVMYSHPDLVQFLNEIDANKTYHYISNACDYEHFSKARERIGARPVDFPSTDKPILGYYGAFAQWLDFDIIRKHADEGVYHIVMIGGIVTSASYNLRFGHPNITWLAHKSYDELPYYLSWFDKCFLPFKDCELTKYVNPCKLWEYMASEKEIIKYNVNMNVDKIVTYEDVCNKIVKIIHYNLSVIILCFNQLEYTKQCIESVLQNTVCDSYEVVVVNNGSTDGTNEYLESLGSKHTNIKVINNAENLGFSKGMNIGVRNSCGEYIILLNNDTIVDINWDYSLINILKTNANVFAVTPITNNCGNEAILEIKHTNYIDYFEKYNMLKTNLVSHFNATSLALFCGCFRRVDFINIGYLDETYLNGWEDDDLYNTILLQNKTVLISTRSVVYHFGSVTVGPSAYSQSNNANRLYYERKWRFLWKSHSISNVNKKINIQERLKHINVFIFLSTNNLDTLATMIQNTLRCINIDSTITYKLTPDCVNDISSIYIILYNDRSVEFMPKYYIFYQIEQFSLKASPVKKFDERYYKDMNNALAIFEFSKENIACYKNHIHDQSKIFYLPFPFSNIYDISFVDEYKYDIVFFGARSSRRECILDKLYCELGSKYRIKYLYGVGNKDRDDILKQSRCVLNLHYYPEALLEIERINTSINCNCIVISETSINGASNEYYDFVKYFDVFTENEINNGSSLNIDRLINCIEYNLEPVKFNNNLTELQTYKSKLAEIGRFFYQKVFLAVDQFSIRIDNNNINYPLVNIPYCVTLFENNTRYNIVKSNAYTPSHYKFPAMKYKKGTVGCAMSYKILCYNADRLKLPSIVIFEDDCLFKENFAGIYSIIYNLKFVWDIINFYSCVIGYGDIVSAYRINDATYILKVKNIVGTVCNLYNKSMYKYIYNFPFIQSHYNEDPHNMEFHIDRRFHIKDNLLTYCVWPFVVDILDTDSTISNSSSAYKLFKNEESKTNDNVCRFIANNPDKIHKLDDLQNLHP